MGWLLDVLSARSHCRLADRHPRLVARSVATTGAGIIAPLPLISAHGGRHHGQSSAFWLAMIVFGRRSKKN